ncbi:MAG: hypothetical protein GKR93_08825 [Gammaproteobacteria bacterium]|nr:hypothetical protein [Gammaproteobacteria bacterium]
MLLEPSPPDQVIDLIDSDRKIMARHPGLFLKLLPLYMDSDTSAVKTGGAYLFDTYENALAFDKWLMQELVTDGVAYTEREILLEMSSSAWHVVGAHNLKDLYTQQTIMRVEDWQAPAACTREQLVTEWDRLLEQASGAGYSAIWLLHDDEMRKLSLITTFRPEMCQSNPDSKTVFSQLNSIPHISDNSELLSGAEKTFDRSSYIFNIWFPITDSINDQEALWPNEFLIAEQ